MSEHIDLKLVENIHFIGIGGIGCSSLAQILKAKGKTITGSDLWTSEIIKNLEANDIKVFLDQNSGSITDETSLVVYSHAIDKDNPELTEARRRSIPTISYPKALSILSKAYFTIAVSGTHGKSTTTAMLALALSNAGLDPTVVVGTKIREFNNQNFRVGESKYLILEACEYKSSFLDLQPDILAITNIEAEHLDFFKTEENYYNNFRKLVDSLSEKKRIIFTEGEDNIEEIINNSRAEKIPAKAVEFELSVPGAFNRANAGLALRVSMEINSDEKKVKESLKSFEGTWRRMEKKTLPQFKAQFIDDYAHHPTEIKATLGALREQNQESKILCVFQPHQFSRTRELIKEFSESFSAVDKVIIPNIYAVRDTDEDIASTSAQELVEKINSISGNSEFGDGLEQTALKIIEIQAQYDIVITMGAGNITSIYNSL